MRYKLPFLAILVTLSVLLSVPHHVNAQLGTGLGAQTAPVTNSQTASYNLLQPLPYIGSSVDTSGTGAFATYVNGIYKLAILVSGVLAVIMITLGGIQYMGSESFSSKEDGKKKIFNAITGLILLVSSYILLSTINPNLLNLNISLTPASSSGTNTTPGSTSNPGSGPSASPTSLSSLLSSANSTLSQDQATLQKMQATNPTNPNIPILQNKVASDQIISANTQANYNASIGGSGNSTSGNSGTGGSTITAGGSGFNGYSPSGTPIVTSSNTGLNSDGTVPPSYTDTTRATDAEGGYATSYKYPAGTINKDINTGLDIPTPVGPGVTVPAGTVLATNYTYSNGQTVQAGTALPADIAIPSTLPVVNGVQQSTGVVIAAGQKLPAGISLDANSIPFVTTPLDPTTGKPSIPLGTILTEVNNSVTNADGTHPSTNVIVGDVGHNFTENSVKAAQLLGTADGTKDATNNTNVSLYYGKSALTPVSNGSDTTNTTDIQSQNLANLTADQATLAQDTADLQTLSTTNPDDANGAAVLSAKIAADNAIVADDQSLSKLTSATAALNDAQAALTEGQLGNDPNIDLSSLQADVTAAQINYDAVVATEVNTQNGSDAAATQATVLAMQTVNPTDPNIDYIIGAEQEDAQAAADLAAGNAAAAALDQTAAQDQAVGDMIDAQAAANAAQQDIQSSDGLYSSTGDPTPTVDPTATQDPNASQDDGTEFIDPGSSCLDDGTC